ncbi:MAG: hypothetical protein JSV34_05180 [Candidatus Omnitrophota bacterium]|nr:MAG: hypothetical protein JSV34_05180 [Candidatus Omnitrophota bacterium]
MKTYDFGLSWSGNIREDFVKYLQQACRRMRLSFLWICDDNVKDTVKRLETHHLGIKVLLDTEATYNEERNIYARLCYAVKDGAGTIINDPDRTKVAVDKSVMHYELINKNIDTPYTVIVRNWEPASFKLTADEKKKLGAPLVIKPASGYGQLGVVRDARGSIVEIARARNFDRGDNFLLQERISPIQLGSRRAWFRVYNVFNRIIPCWWDDTLHRYYHLTYEELNSFRLFPLAKIVSKIAAVTQMVWFSTEIAVDRKFGQVRFVAIDYVNDQCDMTTKSESPSGVPDYIVEETANCIVGAASRFINRERNSKKYTIMLQDASVVDIRGLGNPPQLIRTSLH